MSFAAAVVAKIVQWIVVKFVTYVVVSIAKYLRGRVINKQAEEFERVALELEKAKEKGDADEIARLEKEKIARARELIKFGTYQLRKHS